MGIDAVVLGGGTTKPATDGINNRPTVSFSLDQPVRPLIADNGRGGYRASQPISTQPVENNENQIWQASPSTPTSPLPNLGDTTLFHLFPPFPQTPENLFGRDLMIEALLGLTERFTSVILFGAGGMGKTAVALTLLRHHQIAEKFGRHRHFLSCAVVENSLDSFLERLSDAIGACHSSDMAQLLSHLEGSPCLLVLDGVDSILDPRAPGADEITTAIEAFGRCPKVCLLATSRIDIKIPDIIPIAVTTLPVEAAQDAFHSHCCLEGSAAIHNLLFELDFHPLSIILLGKAVGENNWDEATLLEAWNDGKTSILRASYHQSLEVMIDSILLAPTIQGLGTAAQETLEAIASVPGGVKEMELLGTFPSIHGIGDAVNALCKFSLMYRQDGYVKMLSPFRLYFQGSNKTLVSRPGSNTSYNSDTRDVQSTSRCSSSFFSVFGLRMTNIGGFQQSWSPNQGNFRRTFSTSTNNNLRDPWAQNSFSSSRGVSLYHCFTFDLVS